MSYLEAAESLREECKRHSKLELPKLGIKLPKCIEKLDRLLPLLEAIACCIWWCPGKAKPHVVQRITGKGVSYTLSALELAYMGHYDEALSLARTVGESTNLTWLFCLESDCFIEWQALDSRERWSKYSPAKVRRRILSNNSLVPIDEDRYSTLSSQTAHIAPSSTPQNFNPQIPTLGGYFQEAGFISAINEISAPIAILGASAIRLLPELPSENREEIKEISVDVLNHIGGVDLKKVVELRTQQENE